MAPCLQGGLRAPKIPNRSHPPLPASAGTRRTVAWFPKDGVARDLNVSVLVTNVSFEFTQLGSFGSAAAFGQNLVNSLDRSQLLREQERTGKPSKDPIQVRTRPPPPCPCFPALRMKLELGFKSCGAKHKATMCCPLIPTHRTQLAKLVDYDSKRGQYQVEYTVQVGGQ